MPHVERPLYFATICCRGETASRSEMAAAAWAAWCPIGDAVRGDSDNKCFSVTEKFRRFGGDCVRVCVRTGGDEARGLTVTVRGEVVAQRVRRGEV